MPVITVKKAGPGQGTIRVGANTCGPECTEWLLPSADGRPLTVEVIPASDSYFVRWEDQAGLPLEGIHYAQPGDTVYAVFEKKK
jgi:hypothetical protein